MNNNLSTILLSLLFFFLLVQSKPLTKQNLQSPKNSQSKIPLIKRENHPKEYYDELVAKGILLDNLTEGHPPFPFEEKMDYEADKKRRKRIIEEFHKTKNRRRLTETEQTLENIGFFDLFQNRSTDRYNKIMSYVSNSVRKDESKFILYPYPFEYVNKSEAEPKNIKVEYGGIFDLNQTGLEAQKQNNRFELIQNITTVNIGKAKGIYDIDIAILSLIYKDNQGQEQDLFTSASRYCEYFTNSISKTSTCLGGKNPYLEYKLKNPNKGAVVKVSEKDLLNKTLYDPDTSQLKFKLLIVPDYLTDNEETIFSDKYLTDEAVNVIKKFRDLGGNIISIGKSGYLLEMMGILPEGTYNKSCTIGTKADKQENPIYGCKELYKNSSIDQPDFLKQLICIGYKNYCPLLETYKMNKVPDDFELLINFTNTQGKLYYKEDGIQYDISNKSINFSYILISKEDPVKGRIFLVNGNPEQNFYYFDNVRNMLLYCMTRDYIYDLKIKFSLNEESEEDLPIPAGEEGVQLVANYKFYNLYITEITNFKLEILFAKKIDFIGNAPSGCTLKKEKATKYEGLNLTDFNLDQYLYCEANSIEKLNSISNKFKIEITDYSVTSKLIDIPLMYSSLTFTHNNKDIELNPGIFYAQASIAALLRGTINKDPTSYYPMLGKGLYFDLVLTVENKENTVAKDVKYISLVPLVSPLVDGGDEGLIAHLVPVYEKYYSKHKFTYPWKSFEDSSLDYIDYAEIAGKNVCYVDDFDTPVKLGRKQRGDVTFDEKFEPENEMIYDEKAGPEKGVTTNTLLKQVYFGNSKQFYETAAPRKSLFIDTSTIEGAEAYYDDDVTKIPLDEQDKDNTRKARVHLGFIRLDTYFYKTDFNQYQLPNGFNSSVLISIDHFEQSDAEVKGKAIGEVKGKVKTPGYYDSSRNKYDTHKPNEYYNPMRQYEYMKQYDPTKPEDLEALKKLTTDKIELTHFMCPNKDPTITRAGNVYGFEENNDELSGYFKEYPSIKFIYGHSIELILPPEKTRLGGYAEIILKDGADFSDEDPVKEDRITTSADNVAFYKNVYDKEHKTILLYFKRGLMPNENYGLPSKCQVFLENLNKKSNFTVTINIYDLKYDFSADNFESYYKVDSETKDIEAFYRSFFSFPCLYMENTVSKGEEGSSEILEYELMNPFARYGGYFQELTKHTTVYGSGEAHHIKDPGFQGISGGFSLIHNIGTSSIPFAEFLNHGTLAIPGVSSTSRLEWTDIWGRKWGQNLRSVYPDIPPVPPVPLSFIMTTTFELITNPKNAREQTRVIEWQSDESVYIRVQMKMRNTYKLYWEPTLCHNNQIPIIKKSNTDYSNPIFIVDDTVEKQESSLGDDWDVNLGFSSAYGECYDENSYIAGKKLDPSIIEKMKLMKTCADTLDPTKLGECSQYAKDNNLPIVEKRPENAKEEDDNTPNKTWNYSPLIEKYLPEGYISSGKMWDLTLEDDYWDNEFYKGYPWHLDDCIPNFDNEIIKPHDIIAFPIFKGLGYNITYSQNYSLYKFPGYKGWWSDQLQNKDHTLLAGQEKVNQVSVGKNKSLIDDSKWINGFKLKQTDENKEKLITKRLKNVYVCMFNRHRVKITPGQTKYAFLKNVYQNNVIPILPNLTEKDSRYTNYDCKEDSYQYDYKNISQIDNRVYTGSDRDWLYFAAGLRSYAMEDINVILKLDPIDSTRFEGITKIQDGGRFTYWQPPDGPNSYQYYDGNVNTIIGKRVDLDIFGNLYPRGINTFNTYLFELFEIDDKKEANRTYDMNTYMNSHGYGDSTTSLYVGGVDGTTCRVEPGKFTYVKIVFYNNAGFDWKMKPGAIEYDEKEKSLYLNGMSIMLDKATSIQYPTKYNFMSYEIPDEIKDFVTLSPSQHVVDVSPQFYDLTFNNILTIKDALEGDYYYCLNVSSAFPDHLRGKFWEIKMTFNESWFETFPSEKDPTGIHDYHLTIPSIRFGVPMKEGKYKGKIFYNLGQAKDMYYTFRLYKEFEIQGIKIISEEDIDKLKIAIEDEQNKINNLLAVWDEIPEQKAITDKIKISFVPDKDTFYNLFTINLTEAFPLFPYEEAANKPFVAKINLLAKSFSIHSPYGYRNLMTSSKINYNDGRKIKKKEADHSYINIYTSGPHFSPTFQHKIVKYNEETMKYEETKYQDIYDGDSIIIKLTLKATNEGTATAYNGKFNLKIDKNAVYIKTNQTTEEIKITEGNIQGDEKLIHINYSGVVTSKSYIKFELYFKVQVGQKDIDNIQVEETKRRVLDDKDQFTLVKELDMSLCVVEKCQNEKDPNYGIQKSDVKHNLSYKINVRRDVGKITLSAENIGTETNPKYVLKADVSDLESSYKSQTIEYIFYRKIEGLDDDYKVIKRSSIPEYTDEPFSDMKDVKNYKISYKVIGEFSNGRTVDSSSKENLYEASLSTDTEKEDKGFPAYAIALIAVLGSAAIAGSIFLVYKLLSKKVVENIALFPSENPEVLKSYAGDQTEKKIDASSARIKKRRIQNKQVLSGFNKNINQ